VIEKLLEIWNELGAQGQGFIYIGIIIIVAVALQRTIRWLIDKLFESDNQRLKLDPTMFKFLKNAISVLIWIIAIAMIIYMIPSLRAVAITLFAGAGIFVAIIGFAAQQAFANVISGLFIVLFKPFRVGDMIKVGSMEYGIVEDITLRHTVINNFENKRIIIPNSVISSETVVNDSIHEKKICRWVEVGVSYDTDVEKAISILQEVSAAHPSCIDNRTRTEKKNGVPQIRVRHLRFNDFSQDLRAYVWTDDPLLAIQMHSDINIELKKRFDAEGVEIPFPYRTIVYKKDIEESAKSEES